MGMPKVRIGNVRATMACDFAAHIILEDAKVKPKNRLPQSPIKIFAGLKLKNRKPIRAPRRESVITAITG